MDSSTCFVSVSAKVSHPLRQIRRSLLKVSPENDTLARIGTSCLQQLLESNVKKLSAARWERVATTFVKLFRTTTPHQLFDENLRVEINDGSPDLQDSGNSMPESVSINLTLFF